MSFLAKTYSCGDSGGVRKLVNLTGPWLDVSLPTHGIPAGNQSSLLDIEVDPNNGDNVFVVGEGYCSTQAFNWFGVATSNNGGNTWQVPGGNYQNAVNGACYHKWIEISVVDSQVSYICGITDWLTKLGTIAKSTDGGLTYNMCGLLPVSLAGQDCTSIHFTTPLIGVVGLTNYVVKTNDGGATWIIMNNGQPLSTNLPTPATQLPIGPITGIYISPNQEFIMGIGLDFIVETAPVVFPNPIFTAGTGTDSWQKNSYPPYGYPNPIGVHLTHFNDPSYPNRAWLGAAGYQSLGILYDPLGGASFSPAPGYQLPGLGSVRIAAHFYKKNNSTGFSGLAGFYSKNSDVYYNPLNFDINYEAFSETSPYGVNALWTWYEEQEEICYLLVACDGTSIITNTDMSAYISPSVYIHIVGDLRCFTVTYAEDCTGAVPVVVSGPTYDSCETCNPEITCFSLTDCSGQFNTIYTNTDVSEFVGSVVKLDTYPGLCWQVAITNVCDDSQPLIGTVTEIFVDCESCLKICYKLTDCIGSAPFIITDTDFSLNVGKIIKIVSQPNVCWLVTVSDTCNSSQSVILDSVYDTCEICLALPLIPVVPLKTRKVQPGYDTELCSIEYVEKINCAFSDQVYAKMLQKKYGINQCIEDQFDKYLVKKSILDFNLVYDPTACIAEVIVEECPEIIIVPPTPITCQGVLDVTTDISFDLLTCSSVSNVTSNISYQVQN